MVGVSNVVLHPGQASQMVAEGYGWTFPYL